MRKPTVDILMPTYEPQPEYLLEAIESILAQTEGDWQLFINDDASQTDVFDLVKHYLHDPRVHFSKNEQRLGIGGNWNTSLRKSNADYMQFLFQDDVWNTNYLEKTIDIMTNYTDISLVSVHHAYTCTNSIETKGHYDFVNTYKKNHLQNGIQISALFLPQWLRSGLYPNVIGEPSFVMMKRTLIEKVGAFREDLNQFLDVEYWIRCLRHTDWYYLDEHLGTFRVHKDGTSVRNYESGVGLTERFQCLWECYKTFPQGSPERRTLRNSVHIHLVHIVKQCVRRGLRKCRLGKGLLY
ncbi:hypothetical protein COU77_04080 [Candidatus Peregrinibacteria bacterium CG10_big_fil_rev_8_21_14_0_10_49_16]|nr:MAG: hypothetical protein COW95_04500 [Candidatus Peregrinibacteria bacterium CG22_combo_CG10-13_8_21_14_all_49_11]PIR51741.1 MAG: hypothetical protein COU77_04080 [Candidatus Peregrinibacteria bacterium CG10_big_fil_rev_8_21_14_0_10_49_16]